MSGLDDFVDFVCPLSACGLGSDGGSEGLFHEAGVGSVFELFGGDAESVGEGLPFGKGIAAPPVAACCSRVVCGVETKDNGCPKLPTIMPRMNGMRYLETADCRRRTTAERSLFSCFSVSLRRVSSMSESRFLVSLMVIVGI